MTNEENVTITQTAPDGTETVIEITQTKPDDIAGDDESVVEEVIEALFDTDDDDNGIDLGANTPADGLGDQTDAGIDDDPGHSLDAQGTDATGTADPTQGSDLDAPADDPAIAAAPETSSDTGTTGQIDSPPSADDGTAAAQQGHVDTATDAQQQADQFEAQGDYAAAGEARQVAEDESYAAGDGSMLHGSDSNDLSNAAYQQSNADHYEQQEAAHAQAGDWDAAKEDASNAAYAQSSADYYGGGSDHTGQAKAEESQMDWAGWEQGNADSAALDAEEYAAQGDFDNAEHYAESADSHQDAADYHGALGEHGGDMAVYDSSSEVASGGSYEAPAEDHSSYDPGTTDFSGE